MCCYNMAFMLQLTVKVGGRGKCPRIVSLQPITFIFTRFHSKIQLRVKERLCLILFS